MASLPFIDLKAQYQRLKPRIDQAIHDVLDHGQYIMGPEVQRLEAELAAYTGARHALTCASGTDALLIPLLAYGIGPGDAVFVPAFTYTATAEVKFDEIRSELAGLTGIFDTILRISRLRSDNGSQGFAPTDLAALVRDIGEIYAPVVEDQGDSLIVEVTDDETLRTIADPRMIRQMLVNLIENATNHCPEGVTITLRARPADDGGGVVEVSDTGPGIPASERRAVLEPFRRLDTNRSTPGTGLGLALVAAIAERHGAEVQLDDNNPGLVVRVVFPPRGEQAKLPKL